MCDSDNLVSNYLDELKVEAEMKKVIEYDFFVVNKKGINLGNIRCSEEFMIGNVNKGKNGVNFRICGYFVDRYTTLLDVMLRNGRLVDENLI